MNPDTNSPHRHRLAVSPAEAARMAGIGRTKLYELLGANEIASIKLGARRLIRIADIEAWLERMVTGCEQ